MAANPETKVVPARDAATVIVVREAEGGFEIFMVRRHQKSAFMANAYVYPGGKLDEGDCSEEAAGCVVGLDPAGAAARLGDVSSPLKAMGLFLAGVRETFEEAGILLASRRGESEAIDLTSDREVAARFKGYRKALQEGAMSLSDLARVEDLVLDLSQVGYFAHWITPFFENRRFDTRFFVAVAPRHQRPLHDAVETTDSPWIRPEVALERYGQDDLFLSPPTLRTLEQLAEFASIESLLASAAEVRPPTILPHLCETDGEVCLVFPGNEAFPKADPLYARATPVRDGCTCMVMRDGRWVSVFDR